MRMQARTLAVGWRIVAQTAYCSSVLPSATVSKVASSYALSMILSTSFSSPHQTYERYEVHEHPSRVSIGRMGCSATLLVMSSGTTCLLLVYKALESSLRGFFLLICLTHML